MLANISNEWRALLETEELDKISNTLDSCHSITPDKTQIFNFARLTDLNNISVVILGQDPYPTADYAHGLAFSCKVGVPKSLHNIYRCLLEHKLIDGIPKNGNLTSWAKQGVLLMNCALTTTVDISNDHMHLWKNYTDDLIGKISNQERIISVKDNTGEVKKCIFRPIFLLWGNYAKSKIPLINEKCRIFTYVHPSPLSQSFGKFTECDHFTRVNKVLTRHGLKPINWNTDARNPVDIGFGITEEDAINTTVIFTDGSCFPNKVCKEALAGYATYFAYGPFKNICIYGKLDNEVHYSSNQRAEGYAIYVGLRHLHDHLADWNRAIIITDSDFWIKMITLYIPSWKKQNIPFESKKNPDLTTILYDMMIKLKDKTIEYRHIRSHKKDNWDKEPTDSYKYFCYEGNDYADQWAKYARLNLAVGENVTQIIE